MFSNVYLDNKPNRHHYTESINLCFPVGQRNWYIIKLQKKDQKSLAKLERIMVICYKFSILLIVGMKLIFHDVGWGPEILRKPHSIQKREKIQRKLIHNFKFLSLKTELMHKPKRHILHREVYIREIPYLFIYVLCIWKYW